MHIERMFTSYYFHVRVHCKFVKKSKEGIIYYYTICNIGSSSSTPYRILKEALEPAGQLFKLLWFSCKKKNKQQPRDPQETTHKKSESCFFFFVFFFFILWLIPFDLHQPPLRVCALDTLAAAAVWYWVKVNINFRFSFSLPVIEYCSVIVDVDLTVVAKCWKNEWNDWFSPIF